MSQRNRGERTQAQFAVFIGGDGLGLLSETKVSIKLRRSCAGNIQSFQLQLSDTSKADSYQFQ